MPVYRDRQPNVEGNALLRTPQREAYAALAAGAAQPDDRELGVVRRRLGLRTVRRGGTYVIPESERAKLEQLYEKYGLQSDPAAGEAF